MITRLLTGAALTCIFSLSSCKKDQVEKPKTMITIDVECKACALVFNTEFEPGTVMRVFEKGSYSFELHKIDTLNINAITSPIVGLHQTVDIKVKAGKKTIDHRSFTGYPINEKYDVSVSKFK